MRVGHIHTQSIVGKTKLRRSDLLSLLAEFPISIPKDYLSFVQIPLTASELEAARYSVNKGRPYGGEVWVDSMVATYKLEVTTRRLGRPKKGT